MQQQQDRARAGLVIAQRALVGGDLAQRAFVTGVHPGIRSLAGRALKAGVPVSEQATSMSADQWSHQPQWSHRAVPCSMTRVCSGRAGAKGCLMTQVSDTDAAEAVTEPAGEGEAPTTRRGPLPASSPLSNVSIQSKLILMMVLCTVLAATVVGGIAFQAGRTSLRNAVFDRLTEVRESQTRSLVEQVSDLKNSLIIYTHGSVTRDALEAFTAGFNQLSNAQINPAQWQNIVDYYHDSFIKETEKYSGTKLDAAALLPTSNAQRYLQANYTATRPTTRTTVTITRSAPTMPTTAAMVGGERPIPGLLPPDSHAVRVPGRAADRRERQRRLQRVQGRRPRHEHRGRPLCRIQTPGGVPEGDVVQRRRLRGVHRLRVLPAGRESPTAWMVAPLRRDGRAEGVLALQFPITRSTA